MNAGTETATPTQMTEVEAEAERVARRVAKDLERRGARFALAMLARAAATPAGRAGRPRDEDRRCSRG